MSAILMVGTGHGVVFCQSTGQGWKPDYRALENRPVTSLVARQGRLLAGTRQGVFRSEDNGRSWIQASDGFLIPLVRWLAFHPDLIGFVFAGTEPAGIFVSQNGGDSWRICPEVAALRDQLGWYLPYSPLAGCVRGFAANGDRIYAAVEVGGVLVSDDSGATWRLASGSSGDPEDEGLPGSGFIHADVHSISVYPSSQDVVSAPTGGGFYRSQDGGRSWQRFYDSYCRAVWVDPLDGNHLILGPADGVDRNGRIEESRDGGQTWKLASSGLQVPWTDHMVERFFQLDRSILAILSNGELLESSLDHLEWKRILPEEEDISSVAVLE
jgi:photosystem II stability/assembly factor-like uncharacterized protein